MPNESISDLPTSDWYSSDPLSRYFGMKVPSLPRLIKPLNARNMMMNTGICASNGKHEANGLILRS